jgi:LmbE family N-acetylglucosaminyl deacetylase
LLDEGVRVTVAAFSTAVESLPAGSAADRLKLEFLAAMETLGVPAEDVIVYDYPVRKLTYFRQDVLEELVRLKLQVSPNAVFLPSGTSERFRRLDWR